MGELYIAAYGVATPAYLAKVAWQPENDVGRAYAEAVKRQEWPYDGGDDPSFFCAQYLPKRGGRLTWGICRPDVRNKLRPGDTVAFFGFRPRDGGLDYYFCGYGTVDKKVRQTDIWCEPKLAVYREYLNLLVHPDGAVFRWHEPHRNHRRKVHRDWLWRIANREGFRSKDFPLDLEVFKPGRTCLGSPSRLVKIAENYVVFRPESAKGHPDTYILRDPPLVARHENGWGRVEERWRQDQVAKKIQGLTVDLSRSPHRRLRTRNPTQPHRHIHIPRDAAEWRRRAYDTLQKAELQPRVAG